MPTFTLPLKEVLELEPAIDRDILSSYPIFEEAHRPVLNQKIKDHFWNREIGQETISMFRLALRRKLNEIMPLYNQQYEISAVKFNQLETIKVSNRNTSKAKSANSETATNNSSSDAKSRAVAQELPQQMLAGNGDYATSAQDNTSNTTAAGATSGKSNGVQEGETDSETTGFQGNAAMMVLQWRQSLVNIDMMIIEELETLFMLLYTNGDSSLAAGNYPGPYYLGLW